METKKVMFRGEFYNVPLWAKWIVLDDDGSVCCHEDKPKKHTDGDYYSGANVLYLATVDNTTCMEII